MGHDDLMRDYYDAELRSRADRPLTSERGTHLSDFVTECRARYLSSVIEVGCGAGRDGQTMVTHDFDYTGIDLSAVGVEVCQGFGLSAVQASAIDLPFSDRSFDAGWTMSTLMHLPGDDIKLALAELARVIRPGGLLEIGVWGADEPRVRIDDDGRYFRSRTDHQLRELLSAIGDVEAFETWSRFADTGHYQWARVKIR